jgi:P-type E1-E2 ATPase
MSLLVVAILDASQWWQFGVVILLLTLTQLFITRVNGLATKPNDSAEIQELICYAQSQPSRVQKIIEKVALYWPGLVLVMAILALVIEANSGKGVSACLTVFAAVLLLTQVQTISSNLPMAISVALRAAANAGILIMNRSKFESGAKLKLVLFIKTGILTDSTEAVNAIHLAVNSTIKDEHKLLVLAASVESASEHVFALAIIKAANKADLKIAKPKQIRVIPGYGVQGNVSGKEVLVGSTSLLIQRNIRMEVQDLIYADENTSKGYPIVCIVVDGKLEGLLRFRDTVNPSSVNAVYNVAKDRIRVGLLTGDSAGTAKSVSEQVNISEYYPELDPQRKAGFVRSEQNKGSKVAVFGDLNSDALALNQADLSIAFGSLEDVSSANCDVLIVSSDLEIASKVIRLSMQLQKKIRLGIVFALSYGVVSLGLFVAIVSPLQAIALPAVATLLGSLSLVFVMLNVFSLRKLK